MKSRPALAARLEALHARYHDRRFVAPDPLELVYAYPDPADAEIAGFIASAVAYGRVAAILASARRALAPLGPHPASFLRGSDPADWPGLLRGFVHRWSSAADMLAVWTGLRRVLLRHGSLQSAFHAGWSPGHGNTLPALTFLVRELGVTNSLVPDPAKTGASKRLHMFLRWMIRRDAVDPGLWPGFSPAQLLMPLDVHSFGQCRKLGLTRRRQPNLAAVLDITRAFARLRPDDPVRYDFALSRLGIRNTAALLREDASG